MCTSLFPALTYFFVKMWSFITWKETCSIAPTTYFYCTLIRNDVVRAFSLWLFYFTSSCRQVLKYKLFTSTITHKPTPNGWNTNTAEVQHTLNYNRPGLRYIIIALPHLLHTYFWNSTNSINADDVLTFYYCIHDLKI